MAAPIVAGAAAVFYEYFNAKHSFPYHPKYPSPALMKAALINGAQDISSEEHPYPFMGHNCSLMACEDKIHTLPDEDRYISRFCTEQGWGRLNLGRSIEGPTAGDIYFIDQRANNDLRPGDWRLFEFDVSNSSVPLKVTLAWTDPSDDSTLNCHDNNCVKNHLFLVAYAPDGIIYIGNKFNSYDGPGDSDYNHSMVDAQGSVDFNNNVVNIIVPEPIIGAWKIGVLGLNMGAIPDGLNHGQDFALVYSGAVTDYCSPPSGDHDRPISSPSVSDLDPSADTGVLISWTPPPAWGDGQDDSGRKYEIIREGVPLVSDLPTTTTTYLENTSPNDTVIHYRVNFINSCGYSEASDEFVAMDSTTGGPSSFQVVTVTDADKCNKYGVLISWGAEAGNWGDTSATGRHYEVFRNGQSIHYANYGSASYPDASGISGKHYLYQIKYVNGDGESNFTSPVDGVDADLNAPGAFANPSPSNNATGVALSPTLDWADSSDAASYELFFGISNPPPSYAQGLTISQYELPELLQLKQYYWYVMPFNACGDRNGSGSPWIFTTGGQCGTPGGIPVGAVKAYDADCTAYTGIKLIFPRNVGWNDGDLNRTLRKYKILRKVVPSNYYDTIETIDYKICVDTVLACPEKSYTDFSAEPDTAYRYKVRFINSCGNAVEVEVPAVGDTPNSVRDRSVSPPVPTIASQTGQNTNICLSLTVPLITQSDMLDYQWYRDGIELSCDTATCNADATGLYTVRYYTEPGCYGVSANFPVTIVPCPALSVDMTINPPALSEIVGKGDDDGVIEPGERWRLTVTLRNDSGASAEDVQASISLSDFLIYYNPARFGTIGPAETSTRTFDIVADPSRWFGSLLCGNSVWLGMVENQSNNGAYLYPNSNNIKSVKVGYEGEILEMKPADITVENETKYAEFSTASLADYPSLPILEATVGITVGNATYAKNCLSLDFVDFIGAITPLKYYGDDLKPTYDVKALYIGPPPSRTVHYKLRVTEKSHTSCLSSITLRNIFFKVTKTAGNCDTPVTVVPYPDMVSTAGGTQVSLKGPSQQFSGVTAVKIGVAGEGGTCSSLRSATINSISADGKNLSLTTPAAAKEGWADVKLVTAADTTCLPSVLKLAPLAFTANQNTGDISVVDTFDQVRFAPMPSLALQPQTLPFGMALSRGSKAGRELYIVDYATGNLQIYDAANFQYLDEIQLQDPGMEYNGLGAIDLAVNADGTRAFVIHLTDGLPYSDSPFNPGYGGVSVVDLANRVLLDTDSTPGTQSVGAPPEINRIQTDLYPYTISNLRLERAFTQYAVNDGFPGEYAFVSGVGPQPFYPYEWRCLCMGPKPPHNPCRYPCDRICHPGELRVCWIVHYGSRALKVGVLNLNEKYVDPSYNLVEYEPFPSPRLPFFYLGSRWIGTDGRALGTSNQGLDFSVRSDGLDARVLAVSPEEDRVYAFDFLEAIRNPLAFAYAPLSLACTASDSSSVPCRPVDIKVQQISLGGGKTPLAFTVNASADSLSTIDPVSLSVSRTTIQENMNMCVAHDDPVSIDIRTDPAWAYVANYNSDTSFALNLDDYLGGAAPSCPESSGINRSIPVGMAPVRVVVQDVPSSNGFAGLVKTEITYAPPTAFEQPAQQGSLIQEWEQVVHLQETNANPQAVLVSIDNFQRNATRWISDSTVNSNTNQGIDLYRAAYLQENALPGNP